jgi:multimeric flavodoxin WrbA
MKAIGINGSPRKKWNTATLLEKVLEGTAMLGADTELIHLYNLNYKGCMSCFKCKLMDGNSYGHCNMNDELKSVLQKIEEADILTLGSPIYFGNVTGEMRSFLERLMFQYLVYNKERTSLRKKDIPIGFIYTMNISETMLDETIYRRTFGLMEASLKRLVSGIDVSSLYITDTYQFDDYSKYEVTMFDAKLKAKRREEEFPKDCQKAFELGKRLAIKKGFRKVSDKKIKH